MSTNNVTFEIPTSDIEAKPEFFTEITHTLYGNTKISRHDATGNYFLTSVVKTYNEEKMSKYEALRSKLPSLHKNLEEAKASGNDDDIAIAEAQLKDIETLQKPKKVEINAWLRIDNTKKFLADFKNTEGCSTEQVAFKINTGDKSFHGTYAHRYVMHHLLHWMDSMYAIKVAKLLDRYLVEETERYKEQAEEAKKQSVEFKKQSEEAKTNEMKAKKRYKKLNKRFDDQSEKMDKILEYANALTEQTKTLVENTEQLQITADTTQEQLEENLTYTRQTLLMLEEKSLKSTIDPANPNLITHYAILVPRNRNVSKTRTILVRGQMNRLDKVIDENTNDYEAHVFYSANSINLIINAQARFDQMVADYLIAHNEPINKRNHQLAKAIKEYNRIAQSFNRKHPNSKRVLRKLSDEKESLLCKKDIPIVFGRTYITYERNDYFKYEQVVNCIETMRLDTQRSPADSFDEAENDALEAIANVKSSIDANKGVIGGLPKHISSKET